MRFRNNSLYTRLALSFFAAAAVPLGLTFLLANLWQINLSAVSTSQVERDNLIGILVIFLLLTILAGLFAAHWLALPLNHLTKAAQALAEGDQSAPLPDSSIDEIQRLATTFAQMRDRLAERTAERERVQKTLEENQRSLESRVLERTTALEWANYAAQEAAQQSQAMAARADAIFQTLKEAVVVYDPNGVVQQANRAALELYGFNSIGMHREAIGKQIALFSEQGDGPAVPCELPSARVCCGEVVVEERLLLVNSRGRHFTVLVTASPVIVGEAVAGTVVVWHDITEREKLLENNRRQRLLLERMINEIPVGIAFLQGPDYYYTLANPAYQKIALGREALIGLPMIEVWPELKDILLPILNEVYQTGRTFSADDMLLKLRREHGRLEENYFDLTLSPIFDAQGRVEGIMMLKVDTTARVLARRASEQERARFQAVVENAPVGIALMDQRGQIVLSNPAVERIHGISFMGLNLFEADLNIKAYYPNGALCPKEEVPIIRAAVKNEIIQNMEIIFGRPDGSSVHLLANAAPIDDTGGQVNGAVVLFQDVTDLKMAEKSMRESEARFRGLVESMNDVIITLDKDMRFTSVYGRSAEYFQITGETLIGKTVDEVFQDHAGPHMEAVSNVLRGDHVTYEWSAGMPSGQTHFQTSLSPLVDEQGLVTGAVGVLRDITALKRAELSLESYTARLQHSNQELEQFAFIASHDLQEPLRKIQAFGGIIKKRMEERGEEVEAQDLDYLARVVSASDRMQKMIHALLTFSRVNTKGQPFTKVNLKRVVEEVLTDLEVRLERTGGKVQVGELPELEADPLQMQQLFQNLIGNALKYYAKDCVPVIDVRAEVYSSKSTGQPAVRLFVSDNGIGFEEQHLERIFRPFERLHGRSEYEGTGMGLSICKKIVERHHGTITAHSQLGEGSTFIIDLPIRQKQENVGGQSGLTGD